MIRRQTGSLAALSGFYIAASLQWLLAELRPQSNNLRSCQRAIPGDRRASNRPSEDAHPRHLHSSSKGAIRRPCVEVRTRLCRCFSAPAESLASYVLHDQLACPCRLSRSDGERKRYADVRNLGSYGKAQSANTAFLRTPCSRTAKHAVYGIPDDRLSRLEIDW